MFHLAEMNVARLVRPLDAAENAEFVASLEPVNAIAESTPGFVWRLKGDDGSSSSTVAVGGIDDPLLIVNYSVWLDLDALRHFVYRSGHGSYLRRRREWFEPTDAASTACFWIRAGEIPSAEEAYQRVLHLRANGPSAHAWPFSTPFPPPAD